MNYINRLYLVIPLFSLAACGGGNDPVTSGVFIDAAVEGLGYTTSSGTTGSTNATGAFNYKDGDTVTFVVGGIVFSPVAAKPFVTPLDLANATAPDNPGAVAIARLLQSLDRDNNPDNGITLDVSKLAPSPSLPADWSKVSDVQLAALLKDGASALRSEPLARRHLSSELSRLSKEPSLSLVGRYPSGTKFVAEIVSYHANSKSLFITVDTLAEPSSFKRIDLSGLPSTALSNPTTASNLSVSSRFNVASHVNDGSFTAGGVQSLDVSGDLLAIAVQSTPKTNNGVIAFYNLSVNGDPTFLKKVTVGSLPDGVAFSPDGKFLVVANEGELSNTFFTDNIDPEGSISIISINNGVPADTANTLGFSDFNVSGSRSSELPAAVRIGRPGASVAQDLEPEYVTVSADSKTAFITLQENNAVAVVDLISGRISKIFALGFKNYGQTYQIAASDRYAGISSSIYNNPTTPAPLKNYTNLFGVYMPDGIASYTVGGKTYFLTANEGDDRDDFLPAAETARFSSIVANLDATSFPTLVVNAIKTDQELGRLTLITKDSKGNFGDTDGDGDYDRVYALGSRSFSIWSADTGVQVFDSGDDIERIVYNNAIDDSTNALTLLKASQLLGRLDNKGPEPESVVVGQVGINTYAFIALERSSSILMYNITDPIKPKFVQHIRNHTNLSDGDIAPEGMKFIPASQSPTGIALLAVGFEESGSVAVFQIK